MVKCESSGASNVRSVAEVPTSIPTLIDMGDASQPTAAMQTRDVKLTCTQNNFNTEDQKRQSKLFIGLRLTHCVPAHNSGPTAALRSGGWPMNEPSIVSVPAPSPAECRGQTDTLKY